MDALAAQKRTARRRGSSSHLQQLTRVLRFFEAVAGLLFFSWSSTRLTDAARLSGDLFCRLVALLLSPRFVFLLGNAIVLLLVAKSGRCSPGRGGEGDIYDHLLECRSRMQSCLFPPAELSQCKTAEVPGAGKEVSEEEEEDEEVDAEEFRRTIEAFIAKQQWFRRQESMADVCSVEKPEAPNVVTCF